MARGAGLASHDKLAHMTAMNDATIIDGRHEIDRIDAEICALINERILAARRVQSARIDGRDLEREAHVIHSYIVRIVSRSTAVSAVAQAIIDACRPR